MKNKKGNLPIVILVFLVLTLLLTSIFTGYFFQKNAFEKYEFEKIQEINSNKLLFEQNLYVVLKMATVKTFYEFSLGKDYDYIKNRKNTGEFFELHEMLEENFKERVKKNFLEILNSANTSQEKLYPHYTSLKRDNFDVEYLDEKLKLNFTYISANEQGEIPKSSFLSGLWLIGRFFEEDSYRPSIISLNYKTPVEISIDFEMVSLEGFYEIYSAKENCKALEENEEIKKSIERDLPNFIVKVENVSDYVDNGEKKFPFESIPEPAEEFKLVSLKTKEYFVFEDEIKQIEFIFVSRQVYS